MEVLKESLALIRVAPVKVKLREVLSAPRPVAVIRQYAANVETADAAAAAERNYIVAAGSSHFLQLKAEALFARAQHLVRVAATAQPDAEAAQASGNPDGPDLQILSDRIQHQAIRSFEVAMVAAIDADLSHGILNHSDNALLDAQRLVQADADALEDAFSEVADGLPLLEPEGASEVAAMSDHEVAVIANELPACLANGSLDWTHLADAFDTAGLGAHWLQDLSTYPAFWQALDRYSLAVGEARGEAGVRLSQVEIRCTWAAEEAIQALHISVPADVRVHATGDRVSLTGASVRRMDEAGDTIDDRALGRLPGPEADGLDEAAASAPSRKRHGDDLEGLAPKRPDNTGPGEAS